MVQVHQAVPLFSITKGIHDGCPLSFCVPLVCQSFKPLIEIMVEDDEEFDPACISLFGAQAQIAKTRRQMHLLK